MKLLVVYRVNQYSKKMAGVFTKLIGQLESFEESGFEVFALYMAYGTQTLASFKNGLLSPIACWPNIPAEQEKQHFWINAINAARQCDAEVIYTRYDKMYDKGYLNDFLSSDHVSGAVRCLEFATYPYGDEIPCSSKRENDKLNRKSLMRHVDLVFSTSERKVISGVQNHQFTNQLSKQVLIAASRSTARLIGNDNVLHMLAVANVCEWHGFDRVIRGLAEYRTQQGQQKLQLHIVGEGDAIPALNALVDSLHLNDIVVFEGHHTGKKLLDFYTQASVGVACLGIHRKGLFASSTLKVREYLAHGLPVVYSSYDPLLKESIWSQKLGDDDKPVDISQLIKFVSECSERTDARTAIREFAHREISWRKLTDLVKTKVNEIKVQSAIKTPAKFERLEY